MRFKIISAIGLMMACRGVLATNDQLLGVCTPGPDSSDKRVYSISKADETIIDINGNQSTGTYLEVKVSGQYLNPATGTLIEIPAAMPTQYYTLDSVHVLEEAGKRSENRALLIRVPPDLD